MRFVPATKVLRINEASFPDAQAGLSRLAFVILEAPTRVGLEVEGPAFLHEPVVKVDAVGRAMSNAALRILRVRAEIIAVDRPFCDKLLEYFVCKLATRINFAHLVNAILIELRGVNAVQTVGDAIDVERVAVIRLGGRECEQEKGEY
jgi:hypothetical protein